MRNSALAEIRGGNPHRIRIERRPHSTTLRKFLTGVWADYLEAWKAGLDAPAPPPPKPRPLRIPIRLAADLQT
jgi:hypothetical protein